MSLILRYLCLKTVKVKRRSDKQILLCIKRDIFEMPPEIFPLNDFSAKSQIGIVITINQSLTENIEEPLFGINDCVRVIKKMFNYTMLILLPTLHLKEKKK